MWKLFSEDGNNRVYENSTTGSKCSTTKVYQDREGNNWYMFDDLLTLPYTRNFAATKINSLYQVGMTKFDIENHVQELKKILKMDSPEKYEMAYAKILEFESKAKTATDPVKQMSSLVCVYFLLNDEPIDSFGNAIQMKKLDLLEADIEMHGFFLNLQMQATERYMTALNNLSKIASLSRNEG